MSLTGWAVPAWTIDTSPVGAIFLTKFAERGLSFFHMAHWSTGVEDLPDVDGVILTMTDEHASHAVIERDDWLASLTLEDGQMRLRIGATTPEARNESVDELLAVFPRSEPSSDSVPVSFWTYSANGPRVVSRQITVAPWGVVEGNYPSETRRLLGTMMDDTFRPSHGGQLVLWQGEPGTGKTHALRALAWEWRKWASLHYIVDPDRMFGEHADYLIDVLLHEEYDYSEDNGSKPSTKWRVLVLEDTGELLAADAKEKTGQALSRLLNTVDGMIGQGLKILVLVTTNNELKKLHPAVARPGRCAMQIEFAEFHAEDAHEWATARGLDDWIPNSSQTLAELYAVADGYAKKPSERLVGFAR